MVQLGLGGGAGRRARSVGGGEVGQVGRGRGKCLGRVVGLLIAI